MTDIFCLMSGALKQTKFVLAGLEVDSVQMRKNIDMTHGLVMSEAVMMGLGPYIGREYAHDLVYDICRDALKQQRPLIDLLALLLERIAADVVHQVVCVLAADVWAKAHHHRF